MAPKNASASERCDAIMLHLVPAELEAHRREQRSANSASPREAKRSSMRRRESAPARPSSMAALSVQRPSPESETRPANSPNWGLPLEREAVRSSSHEAMTLPRRQKLGDVRANRDRTGTARGRATAWSPRRTGRFSLPTFAWRRMLNPLRVRGHEPVLDSVVHHLDEVARAVGSAAQVAVLGGPGRPLASRRARSRVDRRGQRGKRSDRAARRLRRRRRSSGSSRAPCPRRRRGADST